MKITWLIQELRVDATKTNDLIVSFAGNTKNSSAILYWIKNPEFPDNINEGYVGVTNTSSNNRFIRHTKNPSRKMQIAFEKFGYELDVVDIASGHYVDMLKLEKYFRHSANIGWNRCTGGFATIRTFDAISVAKKKKLTDHDRISRGELTSYEKGHITRKQTDDRRRKNNLPTTCELTAITRKKNDALRSANGELTSNQKTLKTRTMRQEMLKSMNIETGYQAAGKRRSMQNRKLIDSGELTSTQKGHITRKKNKENKLSENNKK